jgi:hypothetical protein
VHLKTPPNTSLIALFTYKQAFLLIVITSLPALQDRLDKVHARGLLNECDTQDTMVTSSV